MPAWMTHLFGVVTGLLKRQKEPTPAEGWNVLVRSLQRNLKDAVKRIDELSEEVTDLTRKLASCEAKHESSDARLAMMEEHVKLLQMKLEE